VAVAQGIGRIGNWFNQELFGAPTTLPWGLQIGTANRPAGYEEFVTFHPTFLYEMFWVFAAAAVLVWAERKYQLVNGQVFALYIALYCSGRGWIEMLRIDAANQILGLRLNVFTSIIIGLSALIWFLWSRRSTKSNSV
jgi:prolipoprotein diacylglyceryl transferase